MKNIIKCILIDDEPNNIKVLRHILAKHCPLVEVIASETDAEIGLQLINSLQPDLVFLDIEMPNLSGFELLKKIEPIQFEVIFVTAYAAYAIDAFEYHAIGYVTKPIDNARLLLAVNNAYNRIMEKNTTSNIFSLLDARIHQSEETKIPLKTLNGMIFVNKEDIIYCESSGSYTHFYTSESKKLIVSKPIGEFEKSLPEGYFVRIHDKYIINLRYVNEYIKGRGGEIKLNNIITLPVSATRKDNLLARFDRWLKR